MALPAASAFTGSDITEAQFKSAITDLRDYIATMETVAPGVVAFYPKTTAPTGWLKANGAAVSRSTYAALFSAIGKAFGAGDGITTFNIPDLRGEFIRGLDDGRGVDTGRILSNTSQENQNKSHSHTGTAASAGTHAHSIDCRANSGDGNAGVGSVSGVSGGTYATASAGAHTHSVTTVMEGGTEARPRNIALLACIKY